MMIVTMDNIRSMLPFAQPITNSYLESDESFRIVIVTIYFLPVKQTIDINQIKIKTKLICFFFDNAVMKPLRAEVLATFMYQFPLIMIKKFRAVHRHDHFCIYDPVPPGILVMNLPHHPNRRLLRQDNIRLLHE